MNEIFRTVEDTKIVNVTFALVANLQLCYEHWKVYFWKKNL